MIAVYGENSIQVKSFIREHEQLIESLVIRAPSEISLISVAAIRNLKQEIDADFLGSLQQTITSEVLTDFVALSREVLDRDTSDSSKNVSAVLAAAAFEDTLRRLATTRGIAHMDKLGELVNELKSQNILQGSQVGIAISYLNFRNSAMHAQWDRVDRAGIASVLGFVEQLLLSHF